MGVACPNPVDQADGWCRLDGCHGYTRPHIADAPKLKDVKFYGSPDEIAATGDNPAFIKGAPANITVSPAAIRQFRFHHGGAEDEAKVQMRWMLADFLSKSGKVVSETNYLVLSRDGYRLHIAPSRDRITGYTTVHRERTWEQLKRGIPSRIGRIEAEPMPILASRIIREPEPVTTRKLDPIRLDAPKPVRSKPAAPIPGTSAADSRRGATRPMANVLPSTSPKAMSRDAGRTPTETPIAVAAVPPQPLEPPSAGNTLPQATSTDEVGSARSFDESMIEATAQADSLPSGPATPKTKPIAAQNYSKLSGPGTLVTATVSILSTLVVVRGVRWLRRGL
jgi:hypothetical protein